MTLKPVSLQQLKQGLSRVVAEAESGSDVLVTRHGRPVVRITRAEARHVHAGARSESARIETLLRGPTRGRFLEVLLEDRNNGGKER